MLRPTGCDTFREWNTWVSVHGLNRRLVLIYIRTAATNATMQRQIDVVAAADKGFHEGKLPWVQLLREFNNVWRVSDLREFHRIAVETLKTTVATAPAVDAVETGSACVICMSNEASSYIAHGRTAHGGFCPRCALEALLRNRRCPLCRNTVRFIVFKLEKGSCVCGKDECRRNIYMERSSELMLDPRFFEKYDCEEVDKSILKQALCRVFSNV